MTGEKWLQISAARRIIKCPASAVPVAGERGGSEARERLERWTTEGTNAHRVAQQSLYIALGEETKEAVEQMADDLGISQQSRRAIGIYCRTVGREYRQARAADPGAQLLIEEPVELPDMRMRGTVDAAVVSRDSVVVYEFKAGFGDLVDVADDAQSRLYALALSHRAGLKDNASVARIIIQPRRDDGGGTATERIGDLKAWAEAVVRPAAKDALSARPTYYTAGECAERYCLHYAGCPARLRRLSDAAAQAADDIEARGEMTDATLATVLDIGAEGRRIQSAAEKEAERRGRELPGYEYSAARSERIITDADEAARRLKAAGYTDDEIYNPPAGRRLKGVNDLQALTGSRERLSEIMDGIMVRRPCKPSYRRIIR